MQPLRERVAMVLVGVVFLFVYSLILFSEGVPESIVRSEHTLCLDGFVVSGSWFRFSSHSFTQLLLSTTFVPLPIDASETADGYSKGGKQQ